MSFDYHGCFILGKDPISAAVLEGTLRSFGLAFAGASRSLVYEAGSTKTHYVPTRDWAAFISDGNGPTPSAFGYVEAKEFRFDFGFVTLPGLLDGPTPLDGLVRAAWLDISDQQLYSMGFALEDHKSNPLKFFVALHLALNANSMAFGMETNAQQLLKFFSGQLPTPEVHQFISVAIAPPPESAAAMRVAGARREIDVDGVHVFTGYLSGLEEYFPELNA